MKIESPVFRDGESIPAKYTCDGSDVSPPLSWSGVPGGVRSFSLICDDPDAPMGTWVHWVLYNLPGETAALPEDLPAKGVLDGGGLQGKNDFGRIGYGGPCPPAGRHRYFFKLYALDTLLSLKQGADKKELLKAMEGHIRGECRIVGHYAR
ncbi:YbhB/YbcL family Raf kinase inhibitor-like protein [Marispirochaeta aestuarii]|uniref:YbhB/YbcL family Raf kinase inhibitor-like protein n=1 Tax=Marispirochaeta aestuarii TaxID=1963862 RepID=UPI0029C90F13|nr:YbhB/YbcL family Raf kinase inhibitor-like protein [Marispirochaeta aestuarii]